ncbi:MAG TPA: HlyD family type I secretion periplasmic adaptor subunit [Arenibaculum sp.]|nr:HlyD family type I secretion periplasmic adaptor subunit [Arenibaculum sp.]
MSLLPRNPLPERALPKTSVRSLLLAGSVILSLGVGGMTAWAALAPLHSAVVAPGVLVPETGRKTVKHAEGGSIGELLVRDGDTVRAGQVLVRLDPTEAQAKLEMVTADWLTQLALEARLEAELLGHDAITWPDAVGANAADPKVAKLMANQQELFEVRRMQVAQELALLRERVTSLAAEAASLSEQRGFIDAELDILRTEMGNTRRLLQGGNAPRARLLEQQKEEARLQGRDRELAARIAQGRQQSAEAEAEIARRRDERQEKVLVELNAARAEAARGVELRRDAAYRFVNRDIRAPEGGIVIGLKHLAVGGVITPNEPIFDVIPADKPLLVEARVRPEDIEAVTPGMETRLTLSAYDSRIIGTMEGTLEQVSADRLTDPATHQPYFKALIRLNHATPHLVKTLRIMPGMPVEAHILVSPRTPLDYIAAPIMQSYDKAFIQQ